MDIGSSSIVLKPLRNPTSPIKAPNPTPALRNGIVILSEVRFVRETLSEALRQSSICADVHAVAGIAEAAARMVNATPALALIDAALGGGLSAARWLHRRDPACRLTAFNMDETWQNIAAWTKAGIVAYVGRSSTLKEILELIGTLVNDEDINGAPAMTAIPSRAESISERLTAAANSGIAMLTLREQEVARLIIAGDSNKEIAILLNIGLPTVKSHVHNLLVKLGLERRGKLALRFDRFPAGLRCDRAGSTT
jgi:two-component system nitrate/nitrite response regulator NarL